MSGGDFMEVMEVMGLFQSRAKNCPLLQIKGYRVKKLHKSHNLHDGGSGL